MCFFVYICSVLLMGERRRKLPTQQGKRSEYPLILKTNSMKNVSKRMLLLVVSAMLMSAFNNLHAQMEWSLNGNNTNGVQPILGTLDQQPLRFYSNNSQRGIFSQYSGFLGVGINAPKNPLHIHSNDMRGNYWEFCYEDPDVPPFGEAVRSAAVDSSPVRQSTSIMTSDYSGLQITNAATDANPDDGLLLYVHGQQGFLRQLESELFTIGMHDFDVMNFTPEGYVGIGTDQPAQMLHVMDGNILISRTSHMNNRAPGSTNGSILFGAAIDNLTQHGHWGIEYVNDSAQGYGLNFWQPCRPDQITANNRLFLADNGNVGIQTNNPQAELAVNGTVLAKAVRVNTGSTYWPDYVFGSGYPMMTLSELESYVNEYKHLPGIPSAKEVEEQGSFDLGEMNTLLLQKVEELTRYIIDLQKQIDELKKGKEE